MMILIKMALRNLKEHKAKSVIIGGLITLTSFLIVISVTLIYTINKHTEYSNINHIKGDIIVKGKTDDKETFRYDPALPQYENVLSILNSIEGIKTITPMIKSRTFINYSTKEIDQYVNIPFIATSEKLYQAAFGHKIDIIEGRYLNENSSQGEVIMPLSLIREIKEKLNIELKIGDKIKLEKEVPPRIRTPLLVGIYHSAYPDLADTFFVDRQTARGLLNLNIAEFIDPNANLVTIDEEDLFADHSMVDNVEIKEENGTMDTEENILNIFSKKINDENTVPHEENIWQYLYIQLENSNRIHEVVLEINKKLEEADIYAQGVTWRESDPKGEKFLAMLSTILTVMVSFISTMAIFIVMNTLIGSIMERTQEIGSMRAMGAQKRFVKTMFRIETLTISVVFGALGIFLAYVLLVMVKIFPIEFNDIILRELFGKSLIPSFTFLSLIYAVSFVLLIGLTSSVYPVFTALRVDPVKAISAS